MNKKPSLLAIALLFASSANASENLTPTFDLLKKAFLGKYGLLTTQGEESPPLEKCPLTIEIRWLDAVPGSPFELPLIQLISRKHVWKEVIIGTKESKAIEICDSPTDKKCTLTKLKSWFQANAALNMISRGPDPRNVGLIASQFLYKTKNNVEEVEVQEIGMIRLNNELSIEGANKETNSDFSTYNCAYAPLVEI